MKELAEDETCPCGRGLPYGMCCKPNGISWHKDGMMLHQQYTASIPQEQLDMLEENRRRFLKLFGREPSGEDLILFDAPSHNNGVLRQGLTFLRNCGLPEEWKYAYYRTGGLMPTVENEMYLPQHDLDLFKEYCHEYTELMDDDLRQGKINVLLLTSITNSMFESACDTVLPKILSGMEYFLNYVSEKPGNIISPPNSLKEYASFVTVRAIRALESIRMLGIDYKADSIHSMGRSLFECYVYLKNINNNEGFFENKILPILTSHDYGFEISDGGEINYRKIHISEALKNTKRKSPGVLQQLNSSCGPEVDTDLYDYYYRAACQFVHIDAFTARACFYEEDIYTEFDSSLVAIICAFAIAILVLEQLTELSLVPAQQTKDLAYLTSTCAYEICDNLKMLVVDPEQKEGEYERLLERLKMVKGNTWPLNHDSKSKS